VPHRRSPEVLLKLLESKSVVDLPTIRSALGNVSAMTAFRYLNQVPYRRSYNHNGRYYCLHDPDRYDRFGLHSVGDIFFSVDGSLRNTVRRLVQEADAGATHQELQERLQVRVHNTLADLWRHHEIDRERLLEVFVYLHFKATSRRTQIAHRRELLAAQTVEAEVTDTVVIEVLLTLLRHPGSTAANVVRHLRGRSPPISMRHVRIVFDRYDLDRLGEKGGSSNC